MELSVGTPAGMASPESYARRLYFQKRVPQALAAVGMEDEPWGRQPKDLSDGYKRRLALAVQLLRNPAVLLLDEPLAGLPNEHVCFVVCLRVWLPSFVPVTPCSDRMRRHALHVCTHFCETWFAASPKQNRLSLKYFSRCRKKILNCGHSEIMLIRKERVLGTKVVG
jgi:ABC transporter